MRFCILLSAFCLLTSSVGFGQWSEPVMLTYEMSDWAAGPVLAAGQGDTMHALWVGLPGMDKVCGREFAGEVGQGGSAVGARGQGA